MAFSREEISPNFYQTIGSYLFVSQAGNSLVDLSLLAGDGEWSPERSVFTKRLAVGYFSNDPRSTGQPEKRVARFNPHMKRLLDSIWSTDRRPDHLKKSCKKYWTYLHLESDFRVKTQTTDWTCNKKIVVLRDVRWCVLLLVIDICMHEIEKDFLIGMSMRLQNYLFHNIS